MNNPTTTKPLPVYYEHQGSLYHMVGDTRMYDVIDDTTYGYMVVYDKKAVFSNPVFLPNWVVGEKPKTAKPKDLRT